MINPEFQIEADAKKVLSVKDFELLSTPGVIGAYKECELTHIFLFETNTKKFYHYYALLSYEEYFELNNDYRNKYLTHKLISINKDYKLGIKQKRVSFNQAREIFNQLCMNSLTIDETTFVISDFMTILPKTHIPSLWEFGPSLLQKVLKPNFWGDNYIIEFFSNQNPFTEILSANDLIKLNTEIIKNINIDLDNINDRIGSFVFQFPITLIKADIHPTKDWCNAELTIKTYLPFNQNDNIETIISTHLDNLMTSYNNFNGICEDRYIELGDSHNYELLVFNRQNKLVYKHFKCNFSRFFNVVGNLGIHNSEPRIFKNSDGEDVQIDLLSDGFSASKLSDGNYSDRIFNRIHHNEIIKINGNIMIFNKQRKEALLNVRRLIQENSNNSSEIWILDPYLQSRDIIDTLYYHSLLGIKLKCITSYKKSRLLIDIQTKNNKLFLRLKEKLSFIFGIKLNRSANYYFRKYKSEQKEYFLTHSNNLGIILEFRITHDTVGFDFHDRFLFFIPKDSETFPVVYSLGTSINSIGLAHHIIQKVPDARKLVSTFHDLWNLLGNEADRIIKLPEEKQI